MKFAYSLIKRFVPKAPAKKAVAEALSFHSFEAENAQGDLLEINLPPNRYSDAASHIGIAREVAAVSGLKFKNLLKAIINPPENKGFIDIEVRSQKLCQRYAARYFELRPGIGESPKWMKEVLITCGIKPVNRIVDIMNYVMLETGQPLHAFDVDKLEGGGKRRGSKKIVVRKARKGEKIATLDGQKFVLDSETLVIADERKAVAVAGIKGGQNSGVNEKTKRIIVEAANFDPVSVYRSAKRFKLNSDASARFSHGLSPVLVQLGLDRATEFLLKEKAWLLDSVDVYPKPAHDEVVEFSPARYKEVLGTSIDPKKAEIYFKALGFAIEPQVRKRVRDPSAFLVRIPAWRTDVSNPEDLLEEVARFYGYNKLKSAAPFISVSPAHQEDVVTLRDKVRSILVGLRLDEVYNSSFVSEHHPPVRISPLTPRKFQIVELENPISEDKRYLRPSLLPLLLKNVEGNSRFYDTIRIFEIGKVFSQTKRGVKEELSLGVSLARKKAPKLVLEMKGLVDELMRGLGIGDFSIIEREGVLRVEVDHHVLGFLGHTALDKGWTAAFGEFDLDKVIGFTEEAREFIPLKRFPAVVRDISILVGNDVRIGDVVQEIQLVNQTLIENVDLVDEYIFESDGKSPSPKVSAGAKGFGGQVGGPRQSLTFRIIFQAEDRTLTDEEVNLEMEKINSVLRKKFRAEVR